MIQLLKAAVISDTDILVHLVSSGLFFEVMPRVLQQIIIPAKVENELERSHASVYAQLKPLLEKGDWLIRSSTVWKQATKEQKLEINQIKSRMRHNWTQGSWIATLTRWDCKSMRLLVMTRELRPRCNMIRKERRSCSLLRIFSFWVLKRMHSLGAKQGTIMTLSSGNAS